MFENLSGVQLIALCFAVAAPLSVVFIALVGRLNGQECQEGAADPEPLGDMVDVRRIIDRYSED